MNDRLTDEFVVHAHSRSVAVPFAPVSEFTQYWERRPTIVKWRAVVDPLEGNDRTMGVGSADVRKWTATSSVALIGKSLPIDCFDRD